MQSSRKIRQQFIDYFADKHAHAFVPSSPVVPHGDPTLLFTNAGMNQFKDVFLGTGERDYKRAANTQKCIRAGGKHNDLEDVGKDTYHHTFFEMLGNWSFGDYFKKEAIAWAWELLTDVWGLEKDRLHATVFAGDEGDGLEPDTEAEELWQSVTDIDPTHVHRCGKKDNFWEMGETGPCGPCSEIHIDLTPDKSGGGLVNADDARVIEIWNLVFIQFNRNGDGSLTSLPARHVDTGMGFERVTAVIQGKASNYDTDVFTPLFDAIREVTGAAPYGGSLENPVDVAYRVIADHVRCLTFALTDGAVPSNLGRGYVLRRILRRAVRHGRQTLGVGEPFLCKIVPTVVETMGEAFPELTKDPGHVVDLIRDEEESFGRTLDRGIQLFDQAANKAGDGTFSGDDAFLLYDTFGFPLDLTSVMAEERGLQVDTDRFHERMEQAREISRAAIVGAKARETLIEVVQQENPPATEFVGEQELTLEEPTFCLLHVERDNRYEAVANVAEGASVAVVTKRTPFYGEAGGQVGDHGTITNAAGGLIEVEDTIRVGEVYFHLGHVRAGTFETAKPGEEPVALSFEVGAERRQRIMLNHTATHVLNHKLRAVLGDHVAQRGSLVDDEKTRFDFSHQKGLDSEQIERVEQLVNADVDADLAVNAKFAPQEEALKIHGLRAVFGEKYPSTVRVVTVGATLEEMMADPDNEKWTGYSVEFCGGTHLETLGPIRRFAVVGEEAIAKGVRRLTAVTGERAAEVCDHGNDLLERLEALGKVEPEALAGQLTEFSKETKEATVPTVVSRRLRIGCDELLKTVKKHAKEKSKESTGAVMEQARTIADEVEGRVVVASLTDADPKSLKSAMSVVTSRHPDCAVLLGTAGGDKCFFLAAVPEALIAEGLRAGDWVREVAKVAGGGGGGKPNVAQAGGKDPTKLEEALAAGRTFAESTL